MSNEEYEDGKGALEDTGARDTRDLAASVTVFGASASTKVPVHNTDISIAPFCDTGRNEETEE